MNVWKQALQNSVAFIHRRSNLQLTHETNEVAKPVNRFINFTGNSYEAKKKKKQKAKFNLAIMESVNEIRMMGYTF